MGDNSDVFPNNPLEILDTDDGIGDNADLDDDNDFFVDTLENALGSSATSATSR